MAGYSAFRALEQAGWSDSGRARRYSELFAMASNQAIDDSVDALASAPGARVLDLCCGPGNITRALVERGFDVVGLDFSPAMLEIARANAPQAELLEGDAEALDLPDASFDAVVSGFGICHLPHPEQALKEVRRVLRPGGQFAMTVWCGADLSPSFEIIFDAIGRYGDPTVAAPPAPDFHLFAKPDVARAKFAEAGFSDIRHRVLECAWEIEEPEGFYRIFAQSTVRAAAILAAQPEAARRAIADHCSQRVAEAFAADKGFRVPMPAALTVGRA